MTVNITCVDCSFTDEDVCHAEMPICCPECGGVIKSQGAGV